MSLVSKIKNAKVKEASILPEEQVQHLREMTLQYNNIKDGLYNEFKDAVNKYNNENLGFTISSSRYVNPPSYDSLNRLSFSHSYKVVDLMSLVKKLTIKYYYSVIQYVSNLYKLEIEGHEYHGIGIVSDGGKNISDFRPNTYEELMEGFVKLFTTDYDFNPIVKWLAYRTDTLDFTQYGIELFKSKVKRLYFISYNKINWEEKGNTMKITGFKRIGTDYNGVFRTDSNEFNTIQEMFNFFETGDLNKRNGFNNDINFYNNARPFDFPVIEFDNFEKIMSFKLYKNSNAEIKFKDKRSMNEFIEFYNLNYID